MKKLLFIFTIAGADVLAAGACVICPPDKICAGGDAVPVAKSAAEQRTALGLGSAAVAASGDFATAGHGHSEYATKSELAVVESYVSAIEAWVGGPVSCSGTSFGGSHSGVTGITYSAFVYTVDGVKVYPPYGNFTSINCMSCTNGCPASMFPVKVEGSAYTCCIISAGST
jgi:hypothetical protein